MARGPFRYLPRWPQLRIDVLTRDHEGLLERRDRDLEDYLSELGAAVDTLEVDDATYGTATLDFGTTGANEATVAVTGQTDILSTSEVWCWLAGSTADNDEYSHSYATQIITLGIESIVAGVGFTIRGVNRDQSATKTWTVAWGWA